MIQERKGQRVERICPACGRAYPAWLSDLKRGRMKHCSRKCSRESRRAKEHVEFGGESYYLNRHGYYVSSQTGKSLNRAVWESRYGQVPAGHHVCVRDGSRHNYKLANLYLKKLVPRQPCQFEGCVKKAWARGLCQAHSMALNGKTRPSV